MFATLATPDAEYLEHIADVIGRTFGKERKEEIDGWVDKNKDAILRERQSTRAAVLGWITVQYSVRIDHNTGELDLRTAFQFPMYPPVSMSPISRFPTPSTPSASDRD